MRFKSLSRAHTQGICSNLYALYNGRVQRFGVFKIEIKIMLAGTMHLLVYVTFLRDAIVKHPFPTPTHL